MSSQIVITKIAIAYDTKIQVGPHYEKGRIGPPLFIKEDDIPDVLREQIRILASEHAKKYWNA